METAKIFEALRKLRSQLGDLQEQVDTIEALLAEEATPGQQAKQVCDYFARKWQDRYRQRYVFPSIPGALKQVKGLLKGLTVEQVQAAIDRFLKSGEAFYVSGRHTFPMFASSINKWTVTGPGELFTEARPPADCRHVPPCVDDIEHTRKLARG